MMILAEWKRQKANYLKNLPWNPFIDWKDQSVLNFFDILWELQYYRDHVIPAKDKEIRELEKKFKNEEGGRV